MHTLRHILQYKRSNPTALPTPQNTLALGSYFRNQAKMLRLFCKTQPSDNNQLVTHDNSANWKHQFPITYGFDDIICTNQTDLQLTVRILELYAELLTAHRVKQAYTQSSPQETRCSPSLETANPRTAPLCPGNCRTVRLQQSHLLPIRNQHHHNST